MAQIRILFLWHQHQPFYKDLVTNEYRLPWVRMHALKDYYGMVKLLDEFPNIHQTFNLVPSLIAQIQDYVAGTARDPFFDLAAKPAGDFTSEERHRALRYLFQANDTNMIGRYARYRELHEMFHSLNNDVEKAERYFQPQDFTDLQVLSQIAWFDEFVLEESDIAALIKKGRRFSYSEQQMVIARQSAMMAAVLPAHTSAAARGLIEISTSPYYHPILPLLCDTNMGRVSCSGLPLPRHNFHHPEDAAEQMKRGLDQHEKVLGLRPRGIWPSEGSVSNEVVTLANRLGVEWMATDEGVLGRSLSTYFERDSAGYLIHHGPEQLYDIYRYEQGDTHMNMVFRDHSLSDLIGFVYAGMPPDDAASHFIRQLKSSSQSVLAKGKDVVVSIILDGENAWEYYPASGREFLRRLYDSLQEDPQIEALTVSEAIARHKNFGELRSLTPGSWINANFNIWIGAPEDNLAWDYLGAARDFYTKNAAAAPEAARKLAFEELLIAEGSDWNWWYGPEHHSANDIDFDELYRKHLANVYHALGAAPPEYLAQPIAGKGVGSAKFIPQTAYISPRMRGASPGYFDWVGAASYMADRHGSAMHGKQFLLEAAYAGVDAENLYGRLDFVGSHLETDSRVVVSCEVESPTGEIGGYHLELRIAAGELGTWIFQKAEDPAHESGSEKSTAARRAPLEGVAVHFRKVLEFRIPLDSIRARLGDTVRLRFSVWRDKLPVDSLPSEGWMKIPVFTEEQFMSVTERGW